MYTMPDTYIHICSMCGVHAYMCEYGVFGCHVYALVFVGACACVPAEATGRCRSVVLNPWVATPLVSKDPFTGVT